MTPRRIFLRSLTARQAAASMCMEAQEGVCVEFKEPKRTLVQNARLHAMIDDVAEQVVWYGQKFPAWKWKLMFVYAHNDVELVPGIEPGSFVPVYRSTTELTIREASEMMTLVEVFGAEHGVTFSAPASMEPTR